MTYQITKMFTFEASHALDSVPVGHKCRGLHGHSYRVELVLEASDLDQYGFVYDYGNLDQVKRWIDLNLDHKHLGGAGVMVNRTTVWNPEFVTSAENIARYIFNWWEPVIPWLVAVRVSETGRTWAEWHK
jgi:6-pyruvoyltetrahydropterin/6-carboxytetrahydropterin synthase